MNVLFLAAMAVAPLQQQPAYDLLITGGTVLGGTGAPGVRADVAVKGDRIVLVLPAAIARGQAARVIDAAGRVVSPGFIDLHAHDEAIFRLPDAKSRVMQGVTTTLAGPVGGGPYPFGEYLARAERQKLGINIGWLVGYGSVRQAVLERNDRAPPAAELATMQWIVAGAMHQGAFALPSPGAVPLVLEGMKNGGASMVYHVMDEGDVQRILKHRWTAVASDGSLSQPGEGVPHPRAYGTFPRVQGRYVRELKGLTLPEAVRTMTSLPAFRMGLNDRGRIAQGLMADLVVFDPETVADKATFAAPHQYPEGIEYVVVNGQVEVDRGAMTAVRAGRVLRRQRPPAPPVAFVNVSVVPMDRERVLAGHTVVVRDGRIAAMGPSAQVRVPDDAVRVDGVGKFLIPGLAEMHAHVPPGNAPDSTIARVLGLFALNGVTTVRSMLGTPRHLYFRDLAARREILSPRIWASGPSLSGGSVPSPDSAVRMVTAEKALGYDLLKIHPGLSRATFDSMVATADRLGIRFAGHVPLDVGIRRALSAGYATIDHIDGYVEGLLKDGAALTAAQGGFFGVNLMNELDESKLPALVAETKARGVWIVPTEHFLAAMAGEVPVESLAARPDMRYIPAGQIQQWTTATSNLRNALGMTVDMRRRFTTLRRRILKSMHDAGVGILLGSDAPQLWNAPGFSVTRELETYVAAGLTPFQALSTGTRNIAIFLNNESEAGTVAVGKRADLILLDGNPLTRVGNVGRKSGVMVAGRWLPRSEIEARLATMLRP